MIGMLLNFLLAIIVLFIFFKIGELAIGLFGIDAKIAGAALQILKLVCFLILVVWLFEIVGYAHVGFPVIPFRNL